MTLKRLRRVPYPVYGRFFPAKKSFQLDSSTAGPSEPAGADGAIKAKNVSQRNSSSLALAEPDAAGRGGMQRMVPGGELGFAGGGDAGAD